MNKFTAYEKEEFYERSPEYASNVPVYLHGEEELRYYKDIIENMAKSQSEFNNRIAGLEKQIKYLGNRLNNFIDKYFKEKKIENNC